MKLRSDDLVMQEIDGETVLLDLAGSTYFASNQTGTLLLELLKADCEREDLVAALVAEFDISHDQASADADAFVATLREADLLV